MTGYYYNFIEKHTFLSTIQMAALAASRSHSGPT